MRQRALGLAVLVGLLLSCAAGAQEEKSAKVSRGTPQYQMYEDIEILRRLLDRSFQQWAPRPMVLKEHYLNVNPLTTTGLGNLNMAYSTTIPSVNTFSPNSTAYTFTPYTTSTSLGLLGGARPTDGRATEGTYLKGYGVVYSVTLPVSRDPRPAAAKAAPPLPSDWERVRKQLHGEKTEPMDAQKPAGPALRDVILKVLADNGHHFTQLGEEESLTVIVTFRRGEQAAIAPLWIDLGSGRVDVSPPTTPATKSPDKAPPANPSSARDYELLGDLHEKQGHLAEAIEAYQKAVAQNPDPKTAAALYRKLARAYLSQAGEVDTEAKRTAVAKALEFAKRLQEAEAPAAKSAAAPAPVPLPAKLTISAPKKLLDLAGSGKISLEEFKKAATVDYLTFPVDGRPVEKAARP